MCYSAGRLGGQQKSRGAGGRLGRRQGRPRRVAAGQRAAPAASSKEQRRNEGHINGVCSPEKVNKTGNGSNGDGFVQKDIPHHREQRDLPLGGGGCRRNATVCLEKLVGSSSET